MPPTSTYNQSLPRQRECAPPCTSQEWRRRADALACVANAHDSKRATQLTLDLLTLADAIASLEEVPSW
jgi:hypothetical protein